MKRVNTGLLIGSFLVLLTSAASAQIEFVEHTIDDSFSCAYSVYAIDVDGDGDIDVLGASWDRGDITWWENDGNEDFTEHTIAGNFRDAYSVYATDVDGDGDIDVLGAASVDDEITWWENDGNENFTEHAITNNFNGASSVYALDVDGDEDIDVLGAAQGDDDITWWENDGNENFTEYTIAGNFDLAISVYAIDVDGDEDVDVLGASWGDDDITWWENDGNEDFTEHTIAGNFRDAYSVYAIDVDGDGDIDVLGAAYIDDDITWWENDGSENFTEHTIANNFSGASSVYATDIDGDGDVDVLGGASWGDDDITWWENDGSENFTEHTIANNFRGASSVYATDIDGDGDVDVLGGAVWGDDGITWWENLTITQHSPAPFNLLSPGMGDTVWSSDTLLIWSATLDPDPDDILHYDVWLGTEADLSDAVQVADSIADTTFIIEDLEDDEVFYWTVRATDSNTPGTWADDTLSFNVAMPDPPSSFALLSPDNEDTLEFDDGSIVEFEWNSSTDPDPGDEVWYNLRISVAMEDDRVRYLNYSHLQDRSLIVNIPDTLQLDFWNDYLDVSWRVLAVSGEDVIECDERFTFSIAPYNITVEGSSDAIPAKYSIASIYPNPFNPAMTVIIGLPDAAELQVSVFNLLGRQVASIADNKYEAGYHRFSFIASNLSNGIYFVRAVVPGKMDEVRKVVLVR